MVGHSLRCGVLFLLVLLLMVPSVQSQEPVSEKIDAAIDAAVRYLVSKQSVSDGGWHSEYYGSMKQGAATTGLMVYCLSHLPTQKTDSIEQSISRVAGFVRKGITKDGCVGNVDGSLDYPVYATAMILSSQKRLNLGIQSNDVDRMIGYLLRSQCTQQRGFDTANVNYGGWDILGNSGPASGKTPGANVSVTFYVTDALASYSDRNDVQIKQALSRSKQWATRIARQSENNGFYFSAIRESPLNKAGVSRSGKPNSYGSATLDGMGILLNCGAKKDSEVYQKALEWLNRNPQITVPGFDEKGVEAGWPKALQYYYFAACSRTIDELRNSDQLKKKFVEQLLSSQSDDGSWKNAFSNMREDDPLIATAYAVIALCNLSD